uniref:Uncharacterized protein n=1 Tax=Anguilla anguilla TaxID=7936 RepID=A0A0E9W6K7_ANGAN
MLVRLIIKFGTIKRFVKKKRGKYSLLFLSYCLSCDQLVTKRLLFKLLSF